MRRTFLPFLILGILQCVPGFLFSELRRKRISTLPISRGRRVPSSIVCASESDGTGVEADIAVFSGLLGLDDTIFFSLELAELGARETPSNLN